MKSKRELIAIVSGMQIGRPDGLNHFPLNMLKKFLKGEFGDTKSQRLSSQISRLVIAGDSIIQPNKIDEVLRGSYRTMKLNNEVYKTIDEVLESMEQFLDGVSEVMDVDIMPGEMDFSNAFLPQQPLNSCLFPQL